MSEALPLVRKSVFAILNFKHIAFNHFIITSCGVLETCSQVPPQSLACDGLLAYFYSFAYGSVIMRRNLLEGVPKVTAIFFENVQCLGKRLLATTGIREQGVRIVRIGF